MLLEFLRAGAVINTSIKLYGINSHTVQVDRSPHNASAWALVDAIKKAGDFDEYARRQLNVHISMLTKCFRTAMPVDAWSHVAGFYAPRGFY